MFFVFYNELFANLDGNEHILDLLLAKDSSAVPE